LLGATRTGKAREIAARLPGLLILLPTAPVIAGLPRFGPALVAVGVLYFVALARWPRLWLVMMPLVCVGLDLTTWTGRFLFNELDWFFLLTISAGLLFRRYQLPAFSLSPWCWPALVYIVILLAGLERWGVFIDPPGRIQENPYYHVDYGYKLARGALWGLLLAPLWLSHYRLDRERSVNTLVAGAVAAALLLGMIILWERGTLLKILTLSPWWAIVQSLLDLSWSYRVTGLFSDMHTGGEVIDGTVALLLPLQLYGVLYWRRWPARAAAALGATALCYCTLVGFTRATYAAVAFAVVVYLGWEALRHRRSLFTGRGAFATVIAALVLAMLAAPVAYRLAGSYGLASFGGLQVVAFMAWRFRHRSSGPVAVGLVLAALAIVFFAIRAHYTSRWVEASPAAAAGLALVLLAAGIATLLASSRLHGWGEPSRLIALAAIVVGPAILAFGLGGTQINSRMELVGRDFGGRMEHWSRVVESGGTDVATRLLGNGVGSFPGAYLAAYPDTVADVGSFSVYDDGRRFLRLGAGRDLTYGQRVALAPRSDYLLEMTVRAEADSRMSVALCERNILYASNFMPRCVATRLRIPATEGQFVPMIAALTTQRIGDGSFLAHWPTMLSLRGDGRGSTLDIGDVVLTGGDSKPLRNADFTAGTDAWYFFNDYAHLPWHIKNTWLHFWFETGWLGLTAISIAVVLALLRALLAPRREPLLPALATSVATLGVVGLFGTPMDSARVGWLFFFALFVILLLPQPAEPAASRR
jgi:hypothetical protein